MAILLNNLPVTKEAKKLKLDSALAQKLKVVYEYDSTKRKAIFKDLWDKSKKYNVTDIIVPVTSVYGGVTPVNVGAPFVNIIGSSVDPIYFHSSWKDFMKCAYINSNLDPDIVDQCCTDRAYYNPVNHQTFPGNCVTSIVGGHVAVNELYNRREQAGGLVYLLPICRSHNTSIKGTGRTRGTGYYMRVGVPGVYAVILRNYLRGVQLK